MEDTGADDAEPPSAAITTARGALHVLHVRSVQTPTRRCANSEGYKVFLTAACLNGNNSGRATASLPVHQAHGRG